MRSLPNEAAALPKVVSFGGCVIYRTSQYLHDQVLDHVTHRWRRPTLATMSKPIENAGFDISRMPEIYGKYFENDVAGRHLPELLATPKDAILVTDFQRDIVTGVIELAPGSYAMDPVEAIGLLEDLTADTMSREILGEVLGQPYRTLSPFDDWDEFFPLWQREITRFLDTVTAHFKHVIVAEQFQTHQRLDRTGHFSAGRIDEANKRLRQMYAFARQRPDITFITVDPADLYTGRTGGPFGGPTPTHYVDETYALWEVELTKAINTLTGSSFDRSRRIQDVAFARAAAHEEALETLRTRDADLAAAHAAREKLDVEVSTLRARVSELQVTESRLAEAVALNAAQADRIAEMEAALSGLAALQQEHDTANRTIAQMRQDLARTGRALEQTQRTLRELTTPPLKRLSKTIARRTRRIRGL